MSLGSASRVGRLARNRNFCLLLGSALVSQTGDWILLTGVAFQVYVLTGSTVATAVALLAAQMPQVVFGSLSGVLVDRWDRRQVMLGANLLLALVLVPLAAVREEGQVWIIYLVLGLSNCLSPFYVAAEAGLLPVLVERGDQLVTANAANGQARNLARLFGAALGGILVGAGGLTWVALADIASFLAATGMIWMIRYRRVREGVVERPRLLREWAQGLAVIRRSRTLLVILGFCLVSGVGEAIMGTLFAPFVHDVLGGTGRDYGAILGAQAVGGIVGGLLVTVLGHRFAARTLFGWGAVAFGALDLVLFLYPLADPLLPPAIVIISLVGLPGAALFAGLLTLFQLATAEDVRSRVFGALNTAQNAAMLGSTLVAGALAARAGIVPVIAVQGAAYLLAGVGVIAVLRKAPARASEESA